jgi:hypothetical protein
MSGDKLESLPVRDYWQVRSRLSRARESLSQEAPGHELLGLIPDFSSTGHLDLYSGGFVAKYMGRERGGIAKQRALEAYLADVSSESERLSMKKPGFRGAVKKESSEDMRD